MHQKIFDAPRVELTITELALILKTTSKQLDIIISDLIELINKQVCRLLFTQNYFNKLKQILSPGRFTMVQAELDIHVGLIDTLRKVFPWVYSIFHCIPILMVLFAELFSVHNILLRQNLILLK